MEIIAVSELRIGMFVVEPDCPWTEFSFALQGFVVSRTDQIERFREKCRFVSIDRSRSVGDQYAPPKVELDPLLRSGLKGSPGEDPLSGTPTPEQLRRRQIEERRLRRKRFLDFLRNQDDGEQARDLSRELAWAAPRFDEFSDALWHSMNSLASGNIVELEAIRGGIQQIAGSLRRNSDAVMWLLRLKRQDEYSFDHALDVSVNMMLMGIHIGLRGSALHNLGLAGLLQDIGKIQLPEDVLSKTSALTTEEQALVRSHVAWSLEMLFSQSNLPSEVMTIVSRHHERWDGSGYPRGLRFEQIGMTGEIAGLADSYCAMLKDKPYRAAIGHQEALEELHTLRGKKFGPALMEQFVQCIGLYPIGCLVELDSGEVGVVVQQNRVQRARPRILLMLDSTKQPVRAYHVIDLRAAAYAERRIVRSLPANAYGLLADDYYLG